MARERWVEERQAICGYFEGQVRRNEAVSDPEVQKAMYRKGRRFKSPISSVINFSRSAAWTAMIES